jgi:asparagine synthase (glutamine-hydrolysing)
MALAEKLGNVDVTVCNAENISPLEGIDIMMDVHDQPGFVPTNAYWITDILQKSQQQNFGTILTGQGGNATVSWPPSFQIYTKIHFLKSLNKYIRMYLNYLSGRWKKNFIVTSSILRQINRNNEIKNAIIYTPLINDGNRIQLVKPGKNVYIDRWYENGLFYRNEIRDPTLDLKLLNFLMQIPKNKQFKNERIFYNSLFQNYFSNEVLMSQTKGYQSVDISIRLDKLNNFRDSTILMNYIDSKKSSKKGLTLKENLSIYSITKFLKK